MSDEENVMRQCWGCGYKAPVAGSAHVQCVFDWDKAGLDSPSGDAYGISKGWFMFPAMYDPTWMTEKCSARVEKGKADPAMTVSERNPFMRMHEAFDRTFGIKTKR